MMRPKTKILIRKIVIQIFALLFIGFMLLPVYQMLLTALRPADLSWESPSNLLPNQVTLKNFAKAFELVPRFPRYLLNSFIYGIGVSLISLAIAIPAGYALARFRFIMKKPIMIFVIYANMFAPIMLLVPIYVIMDKIGVIDTYFSVILAGSIFTIPLSTWLTVSYMQGIPKEIEDAAFVDGCNHFNIIPKVVLPLMGPALVAIFIYSFITGWSQQFILALVLVKNDKLMPIAQGLYQFFSRSSVRWNELMAAILLSTLVPIILFLVVQKYIVKGLTSGSIK
ncbi:MAG: carbohydrate ABC transporter permease [Thermotogota bacterium]|nr:carbohydrate ABC transporter permease [Thermotogota bacterium]